MDTEDIIGYEALYTSMCKCRRGVTWKGSVAHFVLNDLDEIQRLHDELESGEYNARPTAKFTVTRPKRREIISVCFRDRVYQRSLNDNALYPEMTKSFVRTNWACQKGKGTDYAREDVKDFLRRMYRKFGTDFHIGQADVHGYYPNMSHDTVNAMLRGRLNPDIAERSVKVLTDQYAGGTGYNPGSQMVQIVGISALDDQDHMVKERYCCVYGRYMDDSLICARDRETVEAALEACGELLKRKGLEPNPKKTKAFRVTDGFTFLGFRYRLTDTGKVIMTVDPKNVKAERRKLKNMVRKSKSGDPKLTRDKVDGCYRSWRAHASKGNSFRLLQRMDKFYRDLWKET